ncbi:MAG: S26 family signal peptidase [Haloplanus sp.]
MSADDGPRPPDRHRTADGGDGESTGALRRVLTATDGPLLILRETALSVGAVVAVGLLLFAISGVWPPMVAVESGSMEPHMHKGDLVFITDPERFAPDTAREGTGVVPRVRAREVGYWKFGGYGSVIVYDNPEDAGPPVIHRAQFWVKEGENWYDRANPEYVGADDGCDEMPNCPAPNAGFVTKGDANGQYDQVNGISDPVKPAWIVGIARVRIPYLGWVRLGVSSVVLETSSEMAVGSGANDPTAVELTESERTVSVASEAKPTGSSTAATATAGS